MRDVPARALSIMQPWAHAIVHLGKTIENRDWRKCDFRGEILIHASKGIGTKSHFAMACAMVLDAISPALPPEETREVGLLRGGIVGRARIVGVVDNLRCNERWRARIGAPTFAETRDLTPAESVWWTGGFALVLDDVEPVPFVPCKGALGLWRVPDDVRRAIERAA